MRIDHTELTYLRRREAQERRAADPPGSIASTIHLDLAELFAARVRILDTVLSGDCVASALPGQRVEA
ncbi:hypothetical protein BH09PSE4_BH09PSE4_23720 [soil metagenome]